MTIRQPQQFNVGPGIQLTYPGAPYSSAVYAGTAGNLNFLSNINLSAAYPQSTQDNISLESLGLRYFTANDQIQIVYLAAGQPYSSLIATAFFRASTGVLVLPTFTVATLPIAPDTNSKAFVSDASAPAFLAAVVGGGAVRCPVFYNGITWIVG